MQKEPFSGMTGRNKSKSGYLLLFLCFLVTACLDERQQSELILRHYIDKNSELIRNFSMESTVAMWNAGLSGNERDYKKLIDLELDFNNSNRNTSNQFSPDRFTTLTRNVFTNEKDFQLLRKLKNSGLVTDPILKRQLTVLFQSFMGPQVETVRYKKLRFAETKLWQSYAKVGLELNGRKYEGSQLDSIRKFSSDPLVHKAIYMAYRGKGSEVAGEIIQMVKMRNEFARDFGYRDYYQLALEIKDQTPERVDMLLKETERYTHEKYFEAKLMIDKILAKRYNLPADSFQYYHYNDERTSYLPRKHTETMDAQYVKKDPVLLASDFFNGIGLPVRDVIEKSDLGQKPGKSGNTSIYNVDFKNDLRMMATIRQNMEGMKKMMHLCGHASHYKGVADTIPYLLKDPNAVVAEGIASFFENMVSDDQWVENEFALDAENTREFRILCMHLTQVDRQFRLRRLLVKSLFESAIYADPDQDLGELWYRLNKEYLGIRPPADKNRTDWATNSYFMSMPCSVHNFVLADLFAGQLKQYVDNHLTDPAMPSYQNNKKIGEYLEDQVYRFGDLLPWEQLIEKATGEPLNPAYFSNLLTGVKEVDQKIQN